MAKGKYDPPCVINKDKGTFNGTCIVKVKGGYNRKCFIKENGKRRRCTTNEIVENQGFPSSYKLSENITQKMRDLGESVPPKAAKILAKEVMEKL